MVLVNIISLITTIMTSPSGFLNQLPMLHRLHLPEGDMLHYYQVYLHNKTINIQGSDYINFTSKKLNKQFLFTVQHFNYTAINIIYMKIVLKLLISLVLSSNWCFHNSDLYILVLYCIKQCIKQMLYNPSKKSWKLNTLLSFNGKLLVPPPPIQHINLIKTHKVNAIKKFFHISVSNQSF